MEAVKIYKARVSLGSDQPITLYKEFPAEAEREAYLAGVKELEGLLACQVRIEKWEDQQ